MKTLCWYTLAIFTLTLAGCGGTEEELAAQPSLDTVSSGVAPSATAAKPAGSITSAEEVARAARGQVDCPAKIAGTDRPPGALADDVIGLRPGLSFDEAINVVLCTDELMVVNIGTPRQFKINTYGEKLRQGFTAKTAEPHVEKTSRQIVKEMQDRTISSGGNARQYALQPGQARWHVGTMGLPEQERVYVVAREEWFAEGRNPTQASVADALIQKYGTPTRDEVAGGQRFMTWAHDVTGQSIPANAQNPYQCQGDPNPDGRVNLRPECGTSAAAAIVVMPDNPEIARSFQVSVVNEAAGYTMLVETEQALQEMDAQRRAKAVEEAAKNADAPRL